MSSPDNLQPEENSAVLPAVDANLLAIFQDEATDLSSNILINFQQFVVEPASKKLLSITRDLHTLKGCAQLIAYKGLVDIVHLLESVFKNKDLQSIKLDSYSINTVEAAIFFMVDVISQIHTKKAPFPPESIMLPLQQLKEETTIKARLNKNNADMAYNNPQEVIDTSLFKLTLQDMDYISQQAQDIKKGYSELKWEYLNIIPKIESLKNNIKKLDLVLNKIAKDIPADAQLLSKEALEGLHIDTTDLTVLLHNMEIMGKHQRKAFQHLEEKLMSVRLISFSGYIPRLKKTTAQVSQKLNKKIEFVAEQVDAEVDKRILEKLMPAFEHLIRNAIDHGIEPELERIKANKNAIGHIYFSVKREGSNIVFMIMDDGKGIDIPAIQKKAIENKMIEPNAVLDKRTVIHLLLQQGFTTRSIISDISGRGIGMDVVEHIVKSLGGRIEIDFKAGSFTVMKLYVPAVQSQHLSVLFQINDIRYAIFALNLIGVARVKITEDAVIPSHISYANKTYPLFHMHTIFEFDIDSGAAHAERKEFYFAVIVDHPEKPFAILVDRMLGAREIVVHSLQHIVRAFAKFQGAAILSDGQLVYCLEPNEMYTALLAQGLL
ncbi:MAG: chemotaxis protein CheA [Candidatus Berkiella sp.]